MIARVLQQLSQKGWLHSTHGVNGGYFLAQDLSQISMLDLMQALNGETSISKCLTADEVCELQSTCNIKSPIHNLNKQLNSFYKRLTLHSVLREGI
jgi:Rrf2 family protein